MFKINIDDLIFINESHEEPRCYYLDLIKELSVYIEMVDEYVKNDKSKYEKNGYEHTIFLFSQSIVEYVKEVYNSLLIGNYYSACAIERTIIENYVCMRIIKDYPQNEMWKYWEVHSHCKLLNILDKNVDEIKQLCLDVCDELKINPKIINRKFVRNNYGWAFSLLEDEKDKLNMFFLSQKINDRIYADYQKLSFYVHGTSLYQKSGTFTFYETIFNMINILFYYTQCLFKDNYGNVANKNDFELEQKINTIFSKELKKLKEK